MHCRNDQNTHPEMPKSLVPELFFRPNDANHAPPLRMEKRGIIVVFVGQIRFGLYATQ